MIRDIDSGIFNTIMQVSGLHFLNLDDKTYRWADPNKVGLLELIVTTNKAPDYMSNGIYRLVEVSNEPNYTGDAMHLELIYNPHKVQGYLLPSGLPKSLGDKKLIIPTDELIVSTFSIENLIAKLRMLSGRRARPAEGTA